MATASLLESSQLKWPRSLPVRLCPSRPLPPAPYPLHLIPAKLGNNLRIKGHSFAKLIVKCSCMDKHLTNSDNNAPSSTSNSNPTSLGRSVSTNPFGIIYNTIIKSLEALKKPAIALILVGLLLLCDNSSAFAASGGRMGGRSFSRSSSSSSSSYSVPPTSSPGFSYSVPYHAPSPFGGGGGGIYVGSAVGFGVDAGSTLFFILAGFTAFMLVSGFLSDRNGDGVLTATEKNSVLKLQVLPVDFLFCKVPEILNLVYAVIKLCMHSCAIYLKYYKLNLRSLHLAFSVEHWNFKFVYGKLCKVICDWMKHLVLLWFWWLRCGTNGFYLFYLCTNILIMVTAFVVLPLWLKNL